MCMCLCVCERDSLYDSYSLELSKKVLPFPLYSFLPMSFNQSLRQIRY